MSFAVSDHYPEFESLKSRSATRRPRTLTLERKPLRRAYQRAFRASVVRIPSPSTPHPRIKA